jgi:hypothetical protein
MDQQDIERAVSVMQMENEPSPDSNSPGLALNENAVVSFRYRRFQQLRSEFPETLRLKLCFRNLL